MTAPRRFGQLAADSHGVTDNRPPLVFLHGLGFDRRQWRPVLSELAHVDPHRRAIAFDLPGHGDSPDAKSYDLREVADLVHTALVEAELGADPVVVGHSIGGVLATAFAGKYPVEAVVNVDQPLLVGPFGDLLRKLEPVLRSPAYGEVWDHMLQGMHIELLPPEAQELVNSSRPPGRHLMLGYWNEVLTRTADELKTERTRDLQSISSYHYVTGAVPPPPYREWLESAAPGVTITVLPGSGHFPHLAHPRSLAELLAS
ncbi:alpha/beta hydrolase [Microbispora sp. NEAU-D428]|uniref:alpha/beta fold hydrolase n=1 Tax=Microbispora sitophila TaxID=2771537 RepID=UPI00186636E5|nr:alpha/beta hydrolase [Microbispora sitophila]MBE3015116.1 alpha/beta hydrolase [Microbispora sitophila]